MCPVQQLASHGLFNVMVQAEGDTWIDDHHTNEDIGELAFCSCTSIHLLQQHLSLRLLL